MRATRPGQPHWTTRRGFIAAAGFGGLSLYGLWAYYGAAPGPLALLGLDGGHGGAHRHGAGGAVPADAATTPASAHGSMAGHGAQGGHGAPDPGPDPQAFREQVERFIAEHELPDGRVHPRRTAGSAAAGLPAGAQDAHGFVAGHGAHGGDHMAEHAPAQALQGHAALADGGTDTAPIDVYLAAMQWAYLPAALRLDAGQNYRFHMMTLDVSHGASIQFGRGGRMLRLRPGRVTTVDLRFDRPGRYLVTCTLYCGAAHDFMQATIEVT